MRFSNLVRQHIAALRALLVLTVILGIAYPVFIWLVAQLPGLRDKADGSLIEANGKPVGSSLIGQSFTDADGNPLPRYFQSRPSAAGNGYDPMATSASNLGPESIVDQPDKPSLLTLVCSRSAAVGELDGVDGARPFCTGGGVGAVLSVIGPRDDRGNVIHPTKVVSVNEPCDTTKTPFLKTYEGVRVECARSGEDYSAGQLVPIRGTAPADPAVPADAVTASGSGLDPHISPAYAELQVNRVAAARGISPATVRQLVADHTDGRTLGFFGEPRVNVLELNIALDALSARG
ncbi:K transporting ATPase KdpC subunit [Mycolicibacterium mageritense DSM 44476 = CIP 104973]|uniref:Potassium-transporting ATPase KdpC subunit n=2 Tax=Mycolicibacterium TaxID=1866885 RepID=A0AAI8TPM4_MYCME|nr:potassium-transporting ATPase subunit C [Mycolicibacterium mageritense]OKH80093.1 potassium ABC transporter ATPase [Mycobacterium sp. SWH-M3]MCC9181293.1 potassium-transporting ATPase subunit C [Mycolicibacterium mageritense]TXI52608.1 MAG: potassium-transporting ATPase subunit C [Mycolicibacterium mageritense]CDO25163.1 K+ transporting ATPase, KdpC subunit [Mycolicibacterium mageritense DSM 44476 = CIP 104973]BBX31415.1 potassium-transporting ATPase KdpC subunit [Mycolicibacterium magerite